jgi:hypothetical protein
VVAAQDQGVELALDRVHGVVHMQAVEVEVKGVVVANPVVLDMVAGLVSAQAPVYIMKVR